MVIPLAAHSRALTSARAVALVILVILVVGASAACRRNAKTEPRRHQLDADSVILPRVTRPPATGVTRDAVLPLTVGTQARRYVLVEPLSLVAGRRYPLVLVFHGDGGDAAGFHQAWPFERVTGSEAFLVYPEGLHRTWDLETTRDNPDEKFVEAVIGEVTARLPIDRASVFAAGYSSGGFMANVLACHRPGMLRAIASNAGGAPYNQREKWGNGYPKCPGQAPVAVLALHGERDGTVAVSSGRFSAEYWAYVNGCATDEIETTGYPECHAYRGCPPGKAVGFCSIPTLGHWVWDSAAEAAWTFFQRQ